MIVDSSRWHLSLERLERQRWPDPGPDATRLVRRVHELHAVPIGQLTVEDLRLLIGQEIGLRWLLPVAVQVLVDNPLAEGDMYAGDLLSNVIRSPPLDFWVDEPALRMALVRALEQLDPHTVEDEGAERIVRTALDRLRDPAT